MSVSDAELVHRATRGEREALAVLFQRYGPAVRERFTHSIPRRWQSVLGLDDLMQETYTDAALHIAEFVPRGEGSFKRWLATIAKNNLLKALQMLEAQKRGGTRRRVQPAPNGESFLALYELLGGTTSTPSRKAARVEARTALERAIDQLPDDYRRAVCLYDLEGRPMEEVAAALERRPGAVFMLRARAHRALTGLLGRASQFFSDSA